MKYTEIPTMICNKFQIIAGGPFLRFAFGEQVVINGDIEFHSAIMLTKEDAKELADVIYKTIASLEQPITVPKDATVN